MELSPFDYTGPLPPERVQGRDELLAELTRRVTARTPTALLGPRRFGKTSVLGRLAADLTEATTITVDLMPVQSSLDAARALLAALLDTGAAVSRDATQVAASIGVNLVALRGEIRATRASQRPDPADAFANLVDTLVRTALRRPTIVVFDEFQQIATVAGGTAVLRAALQHHYKDIGLLFAGFAPSAMRDVFANLDQPFLHQADIVDIGPLPLTAVQQIIDDGFLRTGREPGALGAPRFAPLGIRALRTAVGGAAQGAAYPRQRRLDLWHRRAPSRPRQQGQRPVGPSCAARRRTPHRRGRSRPCHRSVPRRLAANHLPAVAIGRCCAEPIISELTRTHGGPHA